MFFKLIRKNSKRNRKENGLFFSSLVISIVAFYIILSLSSQDVMVFLKKMESDAVDRLFQIILHHLIHNPECIHKYAASSLP